ncbi:ATP-binding protein [Geomonas sp. Red32]|uniref:hybrid sensor histidine kinase/response regulator n=1 Tax=Geomonas sp. Red32 TaxID=2912856 RepID=UPI00202CC785|nr:hybrid sensor histidine kinase/response regulator [Geomonas sp. Red32]MCM0080336.1 ATP-binding protein [Geomonas sp. Red32]
MVFPDFLKSFLSRNRNGLHIAVFGAMVIVATWVNVVQRVDYERAEEISRFTRENAGRARAFEEHTRRVLTSADSALLYLQMEYHEHGNITLSMLDFMQWAKREPAVKQLAVFDASGNLVESVLDLPKAINIADREHFWIHQLQPDHGLFISKPSISKGTGAVTIFLTRRLTNPDGTFGGVVGIGLKPTFFSSYYDTLGLGSDRSIMLVGRDDRIVRCWRFNDRILAGIDISSSAIFDEAKRRPAGTYEVDSIIDGKKRLSSYRVMQDFPLIVVVAELKETALAPFVTRAHTYYLTASLFTLFVAGFSLVMFLAERRTRSQNQRIKEELEEREKVVRALKESQNLFSEFLDHLPAIAFVQDLGNGILYSNAAYHGFSGDLAPLQVQPGQYQQHGRSDCRFDSCEVTVTDGEGGQRTFDTRRFLVERGGDEPLIGVIAVDISGRRHAQKLEAIGTLAGGVAHDFNNIVTAIVGFASLMQMKLAEGDPLRNYIDNILAASSRAAQLTRSLLAFGRKQEANLKAVDLNSMFLGVEKLLRRVVSEDIEFVTGLASRPLPVMADSVQLEQALMNLVVNARDAMPAGGTLTVRSGFVLMDDEWIEAKRFGAAGEYGVISVADTGTGMDPRTLQRIFEPFFTTKGVGKGTGLGLSMVYGIVKEHGGYIDAASEQGGGTVFQIFLPLVKQEEIVDEKVASEQVRGGAETILLAEDDYQVRSMTREFLEKFGYRVLVAEDGQQAVERVRESAGVIDLVVLDIIMPRKNGKEAYDEIRALAPSVKVLFTSGYTADVITRKGLAAENLQFVAKPVAPELLLRTVRDLLDAA